MAAKTWCGHVPTSKGLHTVFPHLVSTIEYQYVNSTANMRKKKETKKPLFFNHIFENVVRKDKA